MFRPCLTSALSVHDSDAGMISGSCIAIAALQLSSASASERIPEQGGGAQTEHRVGEGVERARRIAAARAHRRMTNQQRFPEPAEAVKGVQDRENCGPVSNRRQYLRAMSYPAVDWWAAALLISGIDGVNAFTAIP